MPDIVNRTCHLCEAACGLHFVVESGKLLEVRPNHDDVFSRGYICPKGTAIPALYDDPDRLRTPVKRTASGDFEPITWGEALDLTSNKLLEIRERHGADANGIYIGNPLAHNDGALLLRGALINALGSRNVFSANSQDTNPRFATSYYLFGSSLLVPIPDINRTDYFFCLGANPRVSNGSFMTAPNVRERLGKIRARGGRIVVVDPRRTETARDADEHVAIFPGTDAALLLSMVQSLLAAGRIDRSALERITVGWSEIEKRLAAFTPERVAPLCGIEPATIVRLANEFASARTAVAYSRVGICNADHGTAASFATDLLNLVTGRLGQVGGSMFPLPAFDAVPIAQMTGANGHNRWHSRVRQLPETLGEIPSATMADEIETPGKGQIRAMVTIAGNPVLSIPNGRRLSQAFEQLEFMAAVDIYINETTRHADVIMPPVWSLTDSHVDLLFSSMSVHGMARYSSAVLPMPKDGKTDWQIMLELVYRLGGGPSGIGPLDALYRVGRHVGWHWSPESQMDLLLRIGPHGDRFMPWSKGLNLKKLKREPNGIDLGPMQPGLQRIVHKDKRVHLNAAPMLAGLDAVARQVDIPREPDTLLLVGRRDLRSNNSWMHNVPNLVSGRDRCVLLVHPDDAARFGLNDGDNAQLESRLHQADVPIRVSTDMRPGVVSLPHGWGHAQSAKWQATAGEHPGVSFNDWTDDSQVELVVGQSLLNGIPVKLRPAQQPANEAMSAAEA